MQDGRLRSTSTTRPQPTVLMLLDEGQVDPIENASSFNKLTIVK
jgi:hypothetical protein